MSTKIELNMNPKTKYKSINKVAIAALMLYILFECGAFLYGQEAETQTIESTEADNQDNVCGIGSDFEIMTIPIDETKRKIEPGLDPVQDGSSSFVDVVSHDFGKKGIEDVKPEPVQHVVVKDLRIESGIKYTCLLNEHIKRHCGTHLARFESFDFGIIYRGKGYIRYTCNDNEAFIIEPIIIYEPYCDRGVSGCCIKGTSLKEVEEWKKKPQENYKEYKPTEFQVKMFSFIHGVYARLKALMK